MSTIRLPVPYRIETISPAAALLADRRSRGAPLHPAEAADATPQQPRVFPARAAPFLAQLLVGLTPDLRGKLGRRDIAERREAAYDAALRNRPSQRPAAPMLAAQA